MKYQGMSALQSKITALKEHCPSVFPQSDADKLQIANEALPFIFRYQIYSSNSVMRENESGLGGTINTRFHN